MPLAVPIAMPQWRLFDALALAFFASRIRTVAEERLLEQSFGEALRQYRNSTPALFPKIV